jgi:alkanesulfonate monooxygenase SsuD/methylene tetrahydromethanopterin reductase-like flavin-dependent oxidoreductase (luciferase family)
VLRATLPHVHAWNTWFDWYGNSPERFASQSAWIDEQARAAGRDPATLVRSACLLVAPGPARGERPALADAPPVSGSPSRIAAAVAELADAGADEVIFVVDPITEDSIRRLGDVVAGLA